MTMKSAKTRMLILLSLVLCLSCLWIGTALAADEADYGNYIRMQLGTMGTPSSVKITVNGAYYIQEAPNQKLVTGQAYTFKASGGKMYLSTSSGDVALGTSAKLVRCQSSDSKNYLTFTNVKYNAATNYPGDMTMTASGSTMTMICRMYLEDYLQGVLAAEMDNGWEVEALKAQAVAARTFALSKTAKGKDYDLTDLSSSYQAFRRYSVSNNKIITAVEATKGQVLYWNGKLSDGLYSCCNGGQTLNASLKWNMSDTYHTMKDDPYDVISNKTVKYAYTFYKEGQGTTDSRATKQIIAAASKALSVDSDKITLLGVTSVTPYGHPDNHPEESRVYTNFSLGVILDVDGERRETELSFTYTTFRSAFTSDYSLLSAMRSVLTVDENEKAFTMTARGWGHSVGLSQAGAQARAADGIGYRDILDFYYTGCTLETLTQKANVLPTLPGSTNDPAATPTPMPTPIPQAERGSGVINVNGSLNVRQGPGTNYESIGILHGGDVVEILELGDTWHKIDYQGSIAYVSARYTTVQVAPGASKTPTATPTPVVTPTPDNTVTPAPVATPSPSPAATPSPSPQGMVGTVKVQGNLNMRKGPGTNYAVITSLKNGTKVTVLEKGAKWHKISYNGQVGYVSASYLTVTGGTVATPTPASTPAPSGDHGSGVISINGSLNVRKGPGTNYESIGIVRGGDRVEILELGDTWHKIVYKGSIGYVSARYTTVEIAPAVSSTPTPVVTPTPVATPTPAATPTPSPVTTPSPSPAATPSPSPQGMVGTVKVQGNLNMRKGPGTNYAVITSLKNGTKVTVLEKGTSWHKISYNGQVGYVSASYLTVTGSASVTTPSPTPATSSAPSYSGVIATGKITAGSLNVRKGPGTNYASLGTLNKGTSVEVLEQSDWLKIVYKNGEGYVSAKYVTLSAATPTPIATSNKLAGKIIGLDPGHQTTCNGAQEPLAPGSTETKDKVSKGTKGVKTGTEEYEVNLQVGLLLKQMLEANGATVVMTRTTNDVNISNAERAQIFNNANVDLALRLHCNNSSNANKKGAFMLVPEDTALSKTEEQIAEILLNNFCASTGAANLGITARDDQVGFNWCEKLIVCIEMGHMSNAEEDVLLSSSGYQWKMAYGLLQGILEYYK